MKNKAKRIVSIVMIIAVVATLCVVLAGCGEQNTKTFELSTSTEKIRERQSYTLEKGTTYYINFSDNTDGYHRIIASASKNVDAVLQTRYPYHNRSWKNVKTIKLTKSNKTENVKVSSGIKAIFDTNVRMNQEYRLVITPTAKTQLTVCWERFVHNMDTDFENGKSYVWIPSITPQQNPFEVKSIFYLSRSEARVMGALLSNQSFINNLKTLDGKKNIPQSAFDKMVGIIKKAVDTYLDKNKDITKFNSANFTKMTIEAFGELISYSIGLFNLNSQMKEASKVLLSAKSPMKLVFSQGNPEQPSKNLYSLTVIQLSARKVKYNHDMYYIYNCKAPECYMGSFTPYKTTNK